MDYKDELIRELGPAFENQERFTADIVSEDNRWLSNGLVILEADGLSGLFVPRDGVRPGQNLTSAATLKTANAPDRAVIDFHQPEGRTYYRFRFE